MNTSNLPAQDNNKIVNIEWAYIEGGGNPRCWKRRDSPAAPLLPEGSQDWPTTGPGPSWADCSVGELQRGSRRILHSSEPRKHQSKGDRNRVIVEQLPRSLQPEIVWKTLLILHSAPFPSQGEAGGPGNPWFGRGDGYWKGLFASKIVPPLPHFMSHSFWKSIKAPEQFVKDKMKRRKLSHSLTEIQRKLGKFPCPSGSLAQRLMKMKEILIEWNLQMLLQQFVNPGRNREAWG